MKFNVTIDRDEDGVWIVECPVIPGCVTQGATKDEALKHRGRDQALGGARPSAGDPDAAGRGRRLMPVLPLVSGRHVVQVFESFGWQVARQWGSHIIGLKADPIATRSVPHRKEVAKGTLRSLIRAAGLSVEAFAAGAERL